MGSVCKFVGCESPVYADDCCLKHHPRHKCVIVGCDKPRDAFNPLYCTNHLDHDSRALLRCGHSNEFEYFHPALIGSARWRCRVCDGLTSDRVEELERRGREIIRKHVPKANNYAAKQILYGGPDAPRSDPETKLAESEFGKPDNKPGQIRLTRRRGQCDGCHRTCYDLPLEGRYCSRKCKHLDRRFRVAVEKLRRELLWALVKSWL